MKPIILTYSQELKRTEGRLGRGFTLNTDEIRRQKELKEKGLPSHQGTKQFCNRVKKNRAKNKIAKQSRKVNRG